MAVRIVTDLQLPQRVKKTLQADGENFLRTHLIANQQAALKLHVKKQGVFHACETILTTEKGTYKSEAKDWDIRNACTDALDMLQLQTPKQIQKTYKDQPIQYKENGGEQYV